MASGKPARDPDIDGVRVPACAYLREFLMALPMAIARQASDTAIDTLTVVTVRIVWLSSVF
jgi:hypothetical protein